MNVIRAFIGIIKSSNPSQITPWLLRIFPLRPSEYKLVFCFMFLSLYVYTTQRASSFFTWHDVMSGNNSTTSTKVLVNLFFKWPYTRNEINDHILYQVFTHYGVLHIKTLSKHHLTFFHNAQSKSFISF